MKAKTRPELDFAKELAQQALGFVPNKIVRFKTGLCHQVYKLEDATGQSSVLRITSQINKRYFEGSLQWFPAARKLGIPVPQLLSHGRFQDKYYAHISYIEGQDLGDVYATLTDNEKHKLAKELSGIIGLAETLPKGDGFGYSIYPLKGKWRDVVNDWLARSRSRLEVNGVFSPSVCDGVEVFINRMEDYLASIQPTAFFPDTTTKNVLMHNNQLAGIVDLDMVCYGDSFQMIGLTRMALLAAGQDTDYIDHLLFERKATPLQRSATILYTLLSCVDFMAEIGMRFANGKKIEAEAKYMNDLSKHYNWLCSTLDILL